MPQVKDKGLFIRVKGTMTVVKALNNIANDVDRELAIRMVDVVAKVGGTAKRRAPVDTGFLKANIKGSIRRQRSNIIGVVTSHARYSIYQEFGSVRNAPHPYMIPAITENEKYIIEKLSGALHDVVMKIKGKK